MCGCKGLPIHPPLCEECEKTFFKEGMNYLMDGNLAMADHIVWETELGNNIGMDIVTYMEQYGVSRIEAEKAILPLYEKELKALEK
ncbi:hypothetical protein CHR37_05010 [Bacillus velezensis]|nr:hypothetical protein CHR37_05010 [Bacillus velezensis]